MSVSRISRFLKVATVVSSSLLVAACGSPTGAAGDDSSIDASNFISSPPPDEQKALTGRDRDIADLIAEQMSPEFRQSRRRCGSVHHLTEAAMRDGSDCSFASTTLREQYKPENGDILEIQVVFHVVQDKTGQGHLDASYIHSQIDVLNEDYGAVAGSPGAPGKNAKIRFRLADKDPQGNPTTGINYVTNTEFFNDRMATTNPMKEALHWDTTKYFNIYTANPSGGILGYATFPQEDAGSSQDGVVLLYTAVGRNAPAGGIYNQGRTATHEVGHYLGLFHTFQDGCGASASPFSSGDRIADTPPQAKAQYDCPSGLAANSCGGRAAVENYMNYTQDTCMNRFSEQQNNRMRCTALSYRASLIKVISGTGSTDTSPPANQAPAAAFRYSTSDLVASFHDASADSDGAIVSYAWNFGDGQSSKEQNPTHTYAAGGEYSVSLTVTDNKGATATTAKAITLTPAAQSDAELINGDARSPLSGKKGDELHFFVSIPDGARNLKIQLNGGSGDADLYVRFADMPSQSTWDYRPNRAGNVETVKVIAPKEGTYYVMVRGRADFKNTKLTASFTATATAKVPESLYNNVGAVTGKAWSDYQVTSNGGTIDMALTWDNGMDLDLYVYNADGAFVGSGVTTQQPELFTFNTDGKAGAYTVRVFNYTGGTANANFNLDILAN